RARSDTAASTAPRWPSTCSPTAGRRGRGEDSGQAGCRDAPHGVPEVRRRCVVTPGAPPEPPAGRAATGGRRALVVTGASTGIGEATARWFLARGWEVYASVRRPGDAPEGTRELVFDVTDPVATGHAACGIDELDGLVANAGIAIAAPLEALPP